MLEILSYEPANQGKKIGYIEVYVPKTGMVLRRIAHLQSADRRWLNYSTYCKELPNNQKIFLPYGEFMQKTHNAEFLECLHSELNKYIDKNNIHLPDPLDLSGSFSGDLPF